MCENKNPSVFEMGRELPEMFSKYFIGQAYLQPLTEKGGHVSNVTFEPGCRNNWHIHHGTGGGQILLVTGGRGWYQAYGEKAQELHPGDVNMRLKEFVQSIAWEKKVTAAQLSLAWLLHQKPYIVPIPGTSRMERMEENVEAAGITFTPNELATIHKLLDEIEVVGERYDPGSENGQSVRK